MKGFALVLLVLAGLPVALRGEGPAAASLDDVLARYAEARGGLQKLRAMKGCKMTGTITLAGDGPAIPLVVWRKRPDRLRVETTVAGVTSIQACNDRQAWWLLPADGPAAREMPPERERAFRRQADFSDPLAAGKKKAGRLELLGDEPGEGGRFFRLKRTAPDGSEVLYWIDAGSGLLHKSAAIAGAGTAAAPFAVVYGDYRPVSGLQMPFTLENLASGRTQAKIAFAVIEIDPALPESLFSMPAGTEAPQAARGVKKEKKGKKLKTKKIAGAPSGTPGRSN